ncbi:MAG: phosphatidylserine decarboxylase family protein [Nitrospirae bacterium]|nr:phosphatidylserine decarboxylase family protein [Nitrospirota bacterium]
MDRNSAPLAAEGVPFVIISGVISILLFLPGWLIPGIISSLLFLFIVWFFRNPQRSIPTGKNLVVSPADGKIIVIKKGEVDRVLKKKMVKISIFMNVFNVHVNRIPCKGKIVDILYNPGKFVSANLDKASLENEQNAVVMETEKGEKVLFIQIAGLIARRIVCRLKTGQRVERGERFGLIRFGSRVDVYLPETADIKVSIGQKVKGGESILAALK